MLKPPSHNYETVIMLKPPSRTKNQISYPNKTVIMLKPPSRTTQQVPKPEAQLPSRAPPWEGKSFLRPFFVECFLEKTFRLFDMIEGKTENLTIVRQSAGLRQVPEKHQDNIAAVISL